jgi:hypothetical protein
VYMYLCIYVYAFMYICTYVYMYICVYVCMYIRADFREIVLHPYVCI